MPVRISNQAICRRAVLERPNSHAIRCRNMHGDLHIINLSSSIDGLSTEEVLQRLAQEVQVPYRCVVVPALRQARPSLCTQPLDYIVVPFQGPVAPGFYPCNSDLWNSYCMICDDRLRNISVLSAEECKECGLTDICQQCMITENGAKICWLCVSSRVGWKPVSTRDQLLHDVYENSEKIQLQLDESTYTQLMHEFLSP